MRSLYARYLIERTPGIHILETSKGYATYTFTDEETVYIQDIYVLPKYRKQNYATKLANTIAFRAKQLGCKTMLGTVLHGANGETNSVKFLKAYGMKLAFPGPQFDMYSIKIG